MSQDNGRCNYCSCHADTPISVVWDVIACSKRCEQALSDLLDGCPESEVKERWEAEAK